MLKELKTSTIIAFLNDMHRAGWDKKYPVTFKEYKLELASRLHCLKLLYTEVKD